MKGVNEMVALLRKIADKFPDRVLAALYQIAQEILTEAKRRCPVSADGGTLRASGMVSEPVRNGKNMSVVISFGGGGISYAISVHETISEHDPPSWKIMTTRGGVIQWTSTGTGDHFLSSVIDEYQPKLAQMLADRVHFDKAGHESTA